MNIQKINEILTIEKVFEESLRDLNGSELISRLPGKQMAYFPLFEFTNGYNMESSANLVYLTKVNLDGIKIMGIDSSIMPIAESVDGVLYALRGAVVSYNPSLDRYEITVDGPRLVYYTRSFVKNIHNLVKVSLNTLLKSIYDTYLAKKVLISIYEFGLLWNLATRNRKVILLYDGSPQSLIIKPKIHENLLYALEGNDVSLVGISKRSRLVKRFYETLIFIKNLGVDSFVRVDVRGYITDTYVGYLNVSSGMPFRIDISRNSPVSTLNIVYSIPSNGSGYPSVLIEAHTISKLRYRDVIGLYMEILERGGIIRNSLSHRGIILGPLEGGLDEAV